MKAGVLVLTGIVTQIQRYSINDGPGIRTTVFLKGCPLRCRWCHNPETHHLDPEIYFREQKCVQCGSCQQACPIPGAIDLASNHRINRELCTQCMQCVQACAYGALTRVGETLTVDEVMQEVCRDIPFYGNSGGGMTISGGEPLYQADFTAALLQEAKKYALHTCVETSGFAPFQEIEKILPYVDLFLYDIKHTDPALHKMITGVGNELILENARNLARRASVRFRLPIIPGVNDTETFIREVGLLAQETGVKACDILPYHDYCESKYKMLGREEDFYKVKLLAEEKVNEFQQILQNFVPEVTLGG